MSASALSERFVLLPLSRMVVVVVVAVVVVVGIEQFANHRTLRLALPQQSSSSWNSLGG